MQSCCLLSPEAILSVSAWRESVQMHVDSNPEKSRIEPDGDWWSSHWCVKMSESSHDQRIIVYRLWSLYQNYNYNNYRYTRICIDRSHEFTWPCYGRIHWDKSVCSTSKDTPVSLLSNCYCHTKSLERKLSKVMEMVDCKCLFVIISWSS